MLGGGPMRNALASQPFPSLTAARWIRTVDAASLAITFASNACPVSDGDLVLAIGKVRPLGSTSDSHRLFAFDAATGAPRWHAIIAAPVTDSFSSAVIDSARAAAYHASGTTISAFSLVDGSLLWQRGLSRPVVNASPVITTDRPGRNRLFITDYDGFGQAASLYCINLDPIDAAINPHPPGAIVWTAPIGGASGNSPTYVPAASGGIDRVYVASVGDFGFSGGVIFAFDITTGTEAWATPGPTADGFFGSVTLARDVTGELSVYAATYAFGGGPSSAALVKLNAGTGAGVWSTPCNRSQTTPVVLPNGLVLLSGGVSGFGSVPSLELFNDAGPGVVRLWHSALDTWTDANTNGTLDVGEYLRIGGWLQQPVVGPHAAGRALVGVLPASGPLFGPPPQLFEVDLTTPPTASGFIVQNAAGSGGSASFASGLIFSIGTEGLTCFGTPAPSPDVNGDGAVTVDDLAAWESGLGNLDVDRSGSVNAADRASLLAVLRGSERTDLGVAP